MARSSAAVPRAAGHHELPPAGARVFPARTRRLRRERRIACGVLSAVLCGDVLAHEDPPGCQGASTTVTLSVFYGDGLHSPGPVSPCETIVYRGSILYPSNGCAFEGGRLVITTPDGNSVDATPAGGIPKLGGGAGVIRVDSAPVTYAVNTVDAARGTLVAAIRYAGGVAHLSTPDVANLPVAATAIVTGIQSCAITRPCVTFRCDPQSVDGFRRGLCTDQTELQGAGAPCPDTDADLCTAARCDARGNCIQDQPACDDHDPCTNDACVAPAIGCRHDAIPGCRPCGDGVKDATEQCDEGPRNGALDSCCDATCKLRRSTYTCRFAVSACQLDATCAGSTGACPDNPAAPADRVCEDGDPCTAGDHCDGQSGTCVSSARVCDAAADLKPAGGSRPRIRVTCRGIPVLRAGAFCEAAAFVGAEFSNRAPCTVDESGEVQITRTVRQPLRLRSAPLSLPLNTCGRAVLRQLPRGAGLRASVRVTLGGIATADPDQRSATLTRAVTLGR